jgi:hypothetical protein
MISTAARSGHSNRRPEGRAAAARIAGTIVPAASLEDSTRLRTFG